MRNEKINVLTVNEVNIASVLRMPYLAPTPGILSIGSDGLVVVSGASGSEVTAAAVLADNAIVRGDGGVRGIQDSLPTISDTGDLIIPDGGELQLGTGLDGRIYSSSDDLIIKNITQDKDVIFYVNDGSVNTEMFRLNADVSQIFLKKDVFTDTQLSQDNNTQFGIGAMGTTLSHVTGNEGYLNTAFGNLALSSLTDGEGNTAIGYQALKTITIGNGNTAIGSLSLQNSIGTEGTAIGKTALMSNTTGRKVTAIGFQALKENTEGDNNLGIGGNAGVLNTTGSDNIYLGTNSGFNNQTGSENILIGSKAGFGVSNNSYSFNVMIGMNSGQAITTGSSNTFIGRNAGDNITTGGNNILIGANTDPLAAGDDSKLNIGNTIYGDLSSKFFGVNVEDPDVALEVMGSTGIKISFDVTDNTTLVTDTSGDFTITPSGSRVIVAGDIEVGSTDGFYYGDPVTDTSWREIRSGTKLSFQRRESSAWVEKGFFDTASFHSDAFHAEADAGIAGSYCWHPGTTPEANPDGPRLWIDGSGDLYLLEQNASPTTRVQNKIVRADANGKVSLGISSPSSALHIKANIPGTVGSHPAGQIIIQNPADDLTANVVITAYESDVNGDPDQQLWYLGSSTSSNSDVTFLNRRDANLTLGTNGNARITILGNGNVGIGTVPDNAFHVYSTSANVIKAERSSSTVDTVLRVLELHRRTTGTAASGIGAEMAFRVVNGANGLETVAVIQGILTDVSETSEEGTLCFEVVSDSELIEALRIQGVSGGSAKIMANCSINAKDGFATELWDVAGSNFETAVVNTEYYSSNQHGGIYGTIYRQYFNTVLTSTNPRLDTGSRVTKMVDFVLHTKYTGNDRGVAHGNMTAYGSSDDHAYIMLSGASGGGNLSFSLTGYSIITGWVDYTK